MKMLLSKSKIALIASLSLGSLGADLLVPQQYERIQNAIDAAVDGDVVIVAPGIYTGTNNENISFRSKDITVRGTDPDDWGVIGSTSLQIPAGKVGIFMNTPHPKTARLSGLSFYGDGAGVHCAASANVSKCRMHSLSTGILVSGATGSIAQCVLDQNLEGGHFSNSNMLVTDCLFIANRDVRGASVQGGNVSMINCLFSDNGPNETNQSFDGGAISLLNGTSLVLINCTLVGNSSRSGGGIWTWGNLSLINTIISGNNAFNDIGDQIAVIAGTTTIKNSIVQDGQDGIPVSSSGSLVWQSGNISADPRLTASHRLAADSPAIDAGDTAAVPAGITLDLDGNTRIIGPAVDMGAYEFTGEPDPQDSDGDRRN